MGRLFRISVSFWANGLRLIDDDGIAVADLRSRAGAGCNVPGLERWGWIHIGDGDPGERRRDGFGSSKGVKPETRLRPTRAGTWARRVWPEKVGQVEAAWRARFGAKVVSALDQALRASGLVRPWGLPQVQPADGFRTHVIPDDGFDPRAAADPDPAPMVARLAAMLTAVTLEIEAESPVSLPLGANFLRTLEDGPVKTKDLPALAGVSKEAATMGIGFLRRHGLGAESDRQIALTATGRAALGQFGAVVGDHGLVGPSPLRDALVAVLNQTDALVEGLRPAEGGWRADKAYRAQTDRILADPVGALPRQPMVLHRGGWPDGS